MDIRILSASDEALINHLISLASLNLSKKEITIINQCIEEIEKIAVLRQNLAEMNRIGLEKEIAQLNNIEDQFKTYLYQLIAGAKMVYHSPRNTFTYFFAGFTCFTALTAYITLSTALLILPLTLLTGVLLSFLLISSYIIFQVNAVQLLENRTLVLSNLKKPFSALMVNLKNIAIELGHSISMLESKINDKKNQYSSFILPYRNEECPPPPYTPNLALCSHPSYFKHSSENSHHNAAETQTTKSFNM